MAPAWARTVGTCRHCQRTVFWDGNGACPGCGRVGEPDTGDHREASSLTPQIRSVPLNPSLTAPPVPTPLMDEEEAELYGGSLLSKLFGRTGGFLDLCAVLALCSGNFLAATALLVVGTGLSYIGYRLAGRRRSSVLGRRSDPGPEAGPGPAAPFASGRWMVVRMESLSAPDGFFHVLTALSLDHRPLLAISASSPGVECLFYPPRFSGQQYEASVRLSGLGVADATYRALCGRRGSDSVASFEMENLWQELSTTSSSGFTVRVTCGASAIEYKIATEGCAEAAKEWRRRIDADLPELAGRLPR
jgi:hypothetical protein